MSDGIYVALGGAVAQQRSLDVVANNVANANTSGFRADRVAFSEAVATATRGRQAIPPSVAVAEIRTDATSGAFEPTGNPLDLAIQGDGWFAIETPNGERYTRAGAMVLDRDGVLRTHAGHAVLGTEGRPIRVARDRPVDVAADGTVRSDGEPVGQLRIVGFSDPNALVKEGLTFYAAAPGARPTAVPDAAVASGYLESANVNVVSGMNELISAGRAFDAFQKIIQGFREIDHRTATDVAAPR